MAIDDYGFDIGDDEERRRAEQGGFTGGVAGGLSVQPLPQTSPFDPSRVPAGVPMAWAEDFVRRNPGDYHRVAEQYASSLQPGGEGGDGGGSAAATSQYTGGGGSGDAALSSFLQYMQQRDAAAQQQQAAMREILMSQLGQATAPVSESSPGVREVLAGQRLGLQRGAERQRKDVAELRAYDGSGGVGGKAFEGDVSRILQQQGEADAMMTGDVLGRELSAKRDQVQRLLSLAMSLGDAESARTLQAQLNAIQTQLAQSNQYDQLAFNYAGLNSNNNLQTLLALLNAA